MILKKLRSKLPPVNSIPDSSLSKEFLNGISEMRTQLADLNAQDISDIFTELDREDIIKLFRILSKPAAQEVFALIESDQQRIIIDSLSDSEIGEVMSGLFVDDAVDFIDEMPANVVKRVLQNVAHDKRRIINQILQYPEDSAGGIMTTEFVDLDEEETVRDAFADIRNTGLNKETIYTCYVIKPDRLLVGVVSAKDIMLASPDDKISDIMDTNFVSAHTTDDQEAIAEMFRRYELLAMPVVDKEDRLVGIITVDDILDVIVEEGTEDIEKMAALNPSDESYMKTGILKQSRNRIFWLMFLMLSATITGIIISYFEDALTVLPILIAFIPMLMDTGGNSGCQTSALVIRGIALGDIKFKNTLTVLWLELRVALLCGLALGAVNFIRIYIMHGRDLLLCLTISVSLIATVLMAKTVGCLLPLAAKKLSLDPAIMAAPLITTIADAASLVVYFSIARMILHI